MMLVRALKAASLTLVLGAASLVPGPGVVARGAAAEEPRELVRAEPGEILVRFRPGVDRTDRVAARRAAGVRLERRLTLPGLELVRTLSGNGVDAAVGELVTRVDVAYAEPNFVYRVDARIPDDPGFGQQWGLDSIDAPEAWDTQTGSDGVLVAVLDTGLEYEHPDLVTNRWLNPGESGAGREVNGLDDDNNGLIDDHSGYDFVGDDNDPRDANGHGTHVAGILGAQGNNGTGVAGVSWDVSIMPLTVCEAGGSCDSASVIDAITYAAAMDADVANMSFSGGSFSQAQKDAITAAPGTLFVASAGNTGTNNDVSPQYPCSHTSTNLICVAASTPTDTRWPNSNFGAASVDLAAPGDAVLSTYPVFTSVFADDFEGTAKWNFIEAPATDPAKWERTTEPGEDAHSPVKSISDSPGGSSYTPNSTATVTLSSPVNLGGRVGCSLQYWVRLQTQPGGDLLRVEAAHGAGPYMELDQWSGTTGGVYSLLTSDLEAFDGETQTGLRFRLTANGDTTVGDGAHVDDVSVRCLKPVASYGMGEGYASFSGTSMAAPHVTGTAALLRAQRADATVSEVRSALLGSVDPVPAFANITATGGRLNAWRAITFPPHERAVRLKLRKHLVARGSVSVTDGFAECLDGALVELQRKRKRVWRTVRVVALDASGAYRSVLSDRTGRYRARVPQTQSGGGVCREAVSASVRHRH